jgi:hypothetical protein
MAITGLPGFAKKNNLSEISAGNLAMANLLSGSSKPFNFQALDIFRSNFKTTEKLSFIPNNLELVIPLADGFVLDTPDLLIDVGANVNLSPGVTTNLGITNSDLLITEPTGPENDTGTQQINSITRSRITDTATLVLSGAANLSRESTDPNRTIKIKKQNNASYSPSSGRFTFGKDIRFVFTDGDEITSIDVKNFSPVTPVDSPKDGVSIYPLQVFDLQYDVENTQYSFRLKRSTAVSDTPILFKLPRVASVKVTGASGLYSAINGMYLYSSNHDHYYNTKNANKGGNPVDSTNQYGFFKFLDGQWRFNLQAGSGGPATTQLGGTGQISLPTSVTEEDGFWSAAGGFTQGQTGNLKTAVNEMIFSLISRDSPDIGTPFTANSPDKLKFRHDAIINFTRTNPVTQANFLSIVPPVLKFASIEDLDELELSREGIFGDVRDLFKGIDGANTITYGYESAEDVDNEVTSDDYTRFKARIDDIRNDVDLSREIIATKIDKRKNYVNNTSNEFIVEGAIIVQDLDRLNSPTGVLGFANSPAGLVPAPYIKEGENFTRAFSTFDGPWVNNFDIKNSPRSGIHTKGIPGDDAYVQDLVINELAFRNSFNIEKFSSPVNIEGTSTAGGDPVTNFDFKMPIKVEETDPITGQITEVDYFLLLQSE